MSSSVGKCQGRVARVTAPAASPARLLPREEAGELGASPRAARLPGNNVLFRVQTLLREILNPTWISLGAEARHCYCTAAGCKQTPSGPGAPFPVAAWCTPKPTSCSCTGGAAPAGWRQGWGLPTGTPGFWPGGQRGAAPWVSVLARSWEGTVVGTPPRRFRGTRCRQIIREAFQQPCAAGARASGIKGGCAPSRHGAAGSGHVSASPPALPGFVCFLKLIKY